MSSRLRCSGGLNARLRHHRKKVDTLLDSNGGYDNLWLLVARSSPEDSMKYRFRMSATLCEWIYWWTESGGSDRPMGSPGPLLDEHGENAPLTSACDKLAALLPPIARAARARQRGWRYERTFALDLTPAEAGELALVLPGVNCTSPESGYDGPRGLERLRERLLAASWKGQAA